MIGPWNAMASEARSFYRTVGLNGQTTKPQRCHDIENENLLF